MGLMTLDEIGERMPAHYLSSVQDGGPSYHWESAPGRGKTTTAKRFPQIMNRVDPQGKYGFVLIQGESETLSGLMGFQQLLNPTKTDSLLRSVFSLPHWWFTKEGKALNEYDGGLILVDEYDKMQLEEKKTVAAMRLEKRVGNHFLPDGWVVWTAGNRKGDRSGSTKDLDFNIGRTITLGVRDSSDAWANWCHANSVSPSIISFGENNPQVLFMAAPTVQGPYCTPRTLVQADIHLRSLMRAYRLTKLPIDHMAQAEVEGGIGKEAAEQLFLHIRLELELPDYDEVVSSPLSVDIPSAVDQKRLFIYKIADKAMPKDAAALVSWVQRFPSEFQIMFGRMVGHRNPLVIGQPAIKDWVKANAALIALVDQFNQRK
jgi:hypothetical protein